MKDRFEFSMVGDGLPEKIGLCLREGHADGLGFDFASPSPVAGMVGSNAAMSQPAQSGKFFFEGLEAPLEFLAVRGE